MSNLRQAAQQALDDICGAKLCEVNSMSSRAEMLRLMDSATTALKQALAELDLDHCPKCGGPADNGHDRCIPPNPYFCSKCTAEPEQKPVVIRWRWPGFEWNYQGFDERASWANDVEKQPLYTSAPTPRTPLTDDEIVAIWGQKPRWHAPPIGLTDIEFARAVIAAYEAKQGARA